MAISPPTYDSGEIAYLRESAALGFLEQVRISGVFRGPDGWMYSIDASVSRPRPVSFYGDKRSMVHGATMYFTEEEFVPLCDALELVEANARRALEKAQAQRAALCPSEDTGS